MQPVRPAFRIGDHLLRGEAHDHLNIFAHERAGKVTRRSGRVDDRGAGGEQTRKRLLRVLHLGVRRKGIPLRLLELRDVGPGAYELLWMTCIIVENPEGILHPDIMSVAVAKPVFDRPSSLFDQRR